VKQKDASIPTIPLNARISRWFGRNLIRIYAFFGFTYLFIPVAYTFAFSFNDSGKSNLVWKGFTLDNWKNPCGAPEVCEALGNSIKIGLLATIFSTILGTMIAFAIGRYAFKGRSSSNLLIFLPTRDRSGCIITLTLPGIPDQPRILANGYCARDVLYLICCGHGKGSYRFFGSSSGASSNGSLRQ
jgi:ABC-type sugar transport system permease subunit